MKKAIVLHGTAGSPDGNWFRWLERRLQDKGFRTWLPALPHSEQPRLSEWLKFVQAECPFKIDEHTLVIGHSSGAILALLLAQECKTKLKAVVCVSVFTDKCGESSATQWPPNAHLFDIEPKWPKIRAGVLTNSDNAKHSANIVVVHSDNDPYVPEAHARWVAGQIGAEFVLMPGQGHFNTEHSVRYRRFLELFDIVQAKGWV